VTPMGFFWLLNNLFVLSSAIDRGFFTGEVQNSTPWFKTGMWIACFLNFLVAYTFIKRSSRSCVLNMICGDGSCTLKEPFFASLEIVMLLVYSTSIACFTLDIQARISEAYPELLVVIFPENALANFQVPTTLCVAGQTLLTLVVSAVYHASFNPLFARAVLTSFVQSILVCGHICVATGGLQHSSGQSMFLLLVFLCGEGSKLSSVYTLERAQRGLFVRSRGLEQELLQEQQAQAFRNEIAQERGRAQAERTIVAFLCHEVQCCCSVCC
jgi:hypothetical protein